MAIRQLALHFDEAFDGPSWPGSLGGEQAVFGRACVGPLGLLQQLETALGLCGGQTSVAERAAALFPRLRQREGSFSASFAADPFGTATRLLSQRDWLRLHGWRDQEISPRLATLAALCADVPAGLPDRLEAVVGALQRRRPDVGRITLDASPADLPPLWQALFATLTRSGVTLEIHPLSDQAAAGDLGAARLTTGFSPTGDGSLQLVRPSGPLAAADDLAAWLAAQDDLRPTVIIGHDTALDAALRAHGLPGCGGQLDDALLQLLPLVVELGWQPADPAMAHQLLSIPQGPLPRPLARRLLGALRTQPAVDSDAWRRAQDEGLARVEDPARRQGIHERISTIFSPAAAQGERYPLPAFEARIAALSSWAKERAAELDDAQATQDAEQQALYTLGQRCDAASALAGLLEQPRLSAADLRRILALAAEAIPAGEARHAEAGLCFLRRPDAIVGPAPRVVWWGFERRSARLPRPLALTERERDKLGHAGVSLPQPGEAALRLARRWRRPLNQCTETLLLICPRRGDDGELQTPHPLWDEISAATDDAATLSTLVRPIPDLHAPAPTHPAPRRALPSARTPWRLEPKRLLPRKVESPSGLERLLGCPLAWALHYRGKLRTGLAAPPSGLGSLLLGSLAHAVVERVLGQQKAPPTAEAGAARAAEVFDTHGPRMAAPLFLPGAESERDDARQRIVAAVESLCAHLRQGEMQIQSVETWRELEALDGALLGGIPDLVVGPPLAIVDLKWGGRQRRQDELAAGTYLQLAAYSYLVAEGRAEAMPQVAYFILRSQELLTAAPAVFADAAVIDGPEPAAVWRQVIKGYERRRAELDGGALENPAGLPEEAQISEHGFVDEDGALRLPPACHFCELDLLCGRFFGGASR